MGDVRGDRERLAATAGQLVCERLEAIDATCAKHNACALRRQKPGGCFA